MRGFARVSSWVDEYKAATTEVSKRKKALRKELAKGSQEQSSKPKRKKVNNDGTCLKNDEGDTQISDTETHQKAH